MPRLRDIGNDMRVLYPRQHKANAGCCLCGTSLRLDIVGDMDIMLTSLEVGRVPLSYGLIDRVQGVIDVTAAGLRARFEPSSEREMRIVRRDRRQNTCHDLAQGRDEVGPRTHSVGSPDRNCRPNVARYPAQAAPWAHRARPRRDSRDIAETTSLKTGHNEMLDVKSQRTAKGLVRDSDRKKRRKQKKEQVPFPAVQIRLLTSQLVSCFGR